VEEYRRLQQELGFDGSQAVYLRVGNTKVLVMGPNDTGKVQLNTPAVLKIQAKPKKGEKYRVNGELGYSYHFTNAK
jgi:ribosomal protein S30